MNLGLFNRVNLKENKEDKGMYSEWTSLSRLVQNFGTIDHSVLDRFEPSVSRDATLNIVKLLASNLGLTQAAEPSKLVSNKEVQWCMEVICYGLSLPLSEHEVIKDCVNIYREWFSALLPIPKVCVPKPICDDPNTYARKMILHFHYLFIPRKGEGIDKINRQAVLCHRVLRTLQQIAHESKSMDQSTWEALLLFLLAINDTLLSPPTVKDDVADQLCERILSVLFEIWLLACANNFPTPPLWKTLRENCLNWRHRVALVEQWNRINLALTSKLLGFMYGPNFPELKISDDDIIPSGMTNDCIAQSWYRFLNTIGNPVNLTKPEVISQTQKFLQFAISGTQGVVDPCQHPSLQALPLIFSKAMKGIASQVDAFLGIAQVWEPPITERFNDNVTSSPTPPTQRRLAKSFSVAPSSSKAAASRSSLIGSLNIRATTSSVTSSGPSSTSSLPSLTSIGNEQRIQLSPDRPTCNSILHLFGEWLFQAAFVGSDLTDKNANESGKRPNSIIIDNTKTSLNLNYSQPMESMNEMLDIPSNLSIDKYNSGKAEAMGTLCRIMCSKKTGEKIFPLYLARFYLAVQQGLAVPASKECGETIVAILLHSADLFRLDLDGVMILIPAFIGALELVLPDKDLNLTQGIAKIDLRKSSVQILLSILALPLHFQNITIKTLINTNNKEKPVTFGQLKPRIMNLVINALQVETDPQNTHMLLGGLFLCVQDSEIYEKIEQVTQPSAESSSNLLSSVSDTSSTKSSSYSDHLLSPDLEIQATDSAHALFVRATYLVCHRLISSWKTDLNVSLAALELLSGLARIHIRESDALECKRAVRWLCDYIEHQCSRPPPSHSKDLHSTIVAAFQCCSIWLLEHSYLLKDKECLQTVLEVAELGISGSKSIKKRSEKIMMKEDKDLKPASMRVRDAAENLLTYILEQVGYFPNECGPESISSLLDEASLLQHCNSWPNDCNSQEKTVERFRYFVAEGSIILALLEEPLGNDQDPQPTITLLIRGPFGRHAWTMQLRHLPRHKSGTKYHAPNMGRPVVMEDIPPKHESKHKYFPDTTELVPKCKVDQSIPNLDAILLGDETATEEINQIRDYFESSANAEEKLSQDQSAPAECTIPSIVHEFQTSRLFLSHFGLLHFEDNLQEDFGMSLIAIDNTSSDFCKDLQLLDNMSPRTCDTVHLFYVKSQQTSLQDIIANVTNDSNLSPYFIKFIMSLGWTVNVNKHPGWTGHASTSWNVTNEANATTTNAGQLYDLQNQVIYWADSFSEIAFVIPHQIKLPSNSQEDAMLNTASLSNWFERNLSDSNDKSREKRILSLDLDKQSVPLRRPAVKCNLHPHTNTKIMVVWLESYEDYMKLPLDDMVQCMNTGLETGQTRVSDILVISLYLMATGLIRVHLRGPTSRVGLACPLIDGMVVSRRALAPLVRQTALNMSRRRRLDSDSYQPPHVRRRLKVQEIVHKYKKEMSSPELLTYLFTNP
ncbi:PREDICTED: ral GTPase-activating protein subunit beta isoform X2 [Nicrophorus vespilloides]|uniref:Ral GTPase-activating protein subunit beta isoform X2 n=1 Tax=Nicrophorus vespilloides TaxID=110193 RepID=A0ABM1N808_NICVS|nr:PREDICTED: ral GTPase-activating protein subunit beta isoform X2 [Nicrophorus vespilloides]